VPGWEELSREQLLVVVAEQAKVIEEQASRIEALAARVVELSRRLGQNSGNSSLRRRRTGSASRGGSVAGVRHAGRVSSPVRPARRWSGLPIRTR